MSEISDFKKFSNLFNNISLKDSQIDDLMNLFYKLSIWYNNIKSIKGYTSEFDNCGNDKRECASIFIEFFKKYSNDENGINFIPFKIEKNQKQIEKEKISKAKKNKERNEWIDSIKSKELFESCVDFVYNIHQNSKQILNSIIQDQKHSLRDIKHQLNSGYLGDNDFFIETCSKILHFSLNEYKEYIQIEKEISNIKCKKILGLKLYEEGREINFKTKFQQLQIKSENLEKNYSSKYKKVFKYFKKVIKNIKKFNDINNLNFPFEHTFEYTFKKIQELLLLEMNKK